MKEQARYYAVECALRIGQRIGQAAIELDIESCPRGLTARALEYGVMAIQAGNDGLWTCLLDPHGERSGATTYIQYYVPRAYLRLQDQTLLKSAFASGKRHHGIVERSEKVVAQGWDTGRVVRIHPRGCP